MHNNDDIISPYLRRRLRTYSEVIGEQTERALGAIPGNAPTGTAIRKPARTGQDDAEPA